MTSGDFQTHNEEDEIVTTQGNTMKKLSLVLLPLIILFAAGWLTTSDTEKLKFFTGLERQAAGLSQKQINIENHTIQYLDGGQGEVILMIHGFGANKDNWLRFAKEFKGKYRIIAPDLPGFGESTILENISYDAVPQAKRLQQFLKALAIDKVHIVGNSMGGYIAGNFSALYPESVKTTWLLNPLGVQGAEPSEMFNAILEGKQPYVLPRNESEFRLLLSKVFVNMPFTPDFAIRALSNDFQKHYSSNEQIALEIHKEKDNTIVFKHPINEVLKQHSNPLLVIWGDQDKILSPDGLRAMKDNIPTATTVMMKDMGHAPMIENPSLTADIVKDFLSKNG
ncbi:alpha/beta hydrolase [Litoribacillus peritrichatus]